MSNLSISDKTVYAYVRRTLSSGVKPIDFLLTPVYDAYYGEVTAYRGYLRVNSIVAGTLLPVDYIDSDATDETLIEFGYRAIEKTLRLKRVGVNDLSLAKWISIKVPTSLVYDDDLYENLKRTVASSAPVFVGDVYLEFPPSLMQIAENRLISALSDIRASGFKVAVSGFGGKAFPMEKLLRACPDMLFSDSEISNLALSREKKTALAPIINYAKSLGATVVACHVSCDEQLKEFRARDVLSFVADDNYKGALDLDLTDLSAETLISKAEAEIDAEEEKAEVSEEEALVSDSPAEETANSEKEKPQPDAPTETPRMNDEKTEQSEPSAETPLRANDPNETPLRVNGAGVEHQGDCEDNKEDNSENIKDKPETKTENVVTEPVISEPVVTAPVVSEVEKTETVSEQDLFIDTAKFSKSGRGHFRKRRR